MKKLSEEQGEKLLQVARAVIVNRLGGDCSLPEDISDELQQQGGTFVTIKKEGQLRGCIGNLAPIGTIWESVKNNAVSAAFFDHRFAELSREELVNVRISVSVLSPSRVLKYSDSDELCRKLQPRADGVILREGRSSATFLPQVWEQLPTPDQFLSQLCIKAGLPQDYWKTERPEIQVYQVQEFSEEP